MSSSIHSWLQKGNRATLCLFCVFTLSIFCKNVLFHYFCFNSILVASCVKHPLAFLLFYAPKMSSALVAASFLFVTRRKYWTIIFSIVLDIWIIANLLYFRANEIFINLDVIMMAGNLNGVESSILTYWKPIFSLFPCLTFCYAILCVLINRKTTEHSIKHLVRTLLIAFICIEFSHYPEWLWWYWKSYGHDRESIEFMKTYLPKNSKDRKNIMGFGYRYFIPFKQVVQLAESLNWEGQYIKKQAITQYFPALFVHPFYQKDISLLNPEDVEVPTYLLNKNYKTDRHQSSHLIVIFVESFESWVLENSEIAQKVVPTFYEFIRKQHVFYANHICSQVRHGVSGDGQMIFNTGLLPVRNGVACDLYAKNTFPNFAHNFNKSFIVTSWPQIWNQDVVTYQYGYKKLYEQESNDEFVFSVLKNELNKCDTPTCAFVITVASHSPFNRVKYKSVNLPQDMPKYMAMYLNCLHYTDSCFSDFLNSIDSNVLNQSTIIVTGDHTIFKESALKDFQSYSIQQNLAIKSGHNFTPLIIYSPQIEGNICVTDTCYQMDIYPTILSLIGCENYYWKGFGVNLLDPVARHNRTILEEDAYRLSDLMIRSNYFSTIEK